MKRKYSLTKKNRKSLFKNLKKSKYSLKKNYRGGGNKINVLVDSRFSTSSFDNMKCKGIVHVTEAIGINVVRGMGTDFANLFGKAGFESELYDNVKQKALRKLKKLVSNKKYKVGNIKMDIETTNATVFCHLIGTVYQSKDLD